WAAMSALLAGAAVIGYALLHPAPAGIPGWEPANDALRAAMDSPAANAAPEASAAPAAGSPHAAAPSDEPSVADAPSASSSVPAQELLDLNSATENQLDALPGIGPAKAKAIVAYRNSWGGFHSVDDLLQVKGIGDKLMDKLRPLVSIGSSRQ